MLVSCKLITDSTLTACRPTQRLQHGGCTHTSLHETQTLPIDKLPLLEVHLERSEVAANVPVARRWCLHAAGRPCCMGRLPAQQSRHISHLPASVSVCWAPSPLFWSTEYTYQEPSHPALPLERPELKSINPISS